MADMARNSSTSLKIIRPDSRLHDSIFKICSHLWSEIYNFREQIWAVYKHNFKDSYHGTKFGVFWNFILPLVPLTVYMFLANIRVFPSFEGVDRSTFLTFGITIWFVLVGFIQIPISIIKSRLVQATKTSFPLTTSIVSSFGDLVFDTAVRLVFMVIIIIVTSAWPSWTSPLLFLVFLPGFFLFFGVGLILGVLNVIYKDVSRIVTMLLRYGIFLSGVIFPLGASNLAQLSNSYNPFAVFVTACRDIVFKGELTNWVPFAIWSTIGIFLFLMGCRVFYIMEYRIRGIN